ncbi:cob(I)yrinic acid a,c-diamide adenosyltransferase [Candidatus Woesearchaeota archaeon]|nr:cob(I)yrinic acid a,c-diamide adenosyltransferase [Candidatus Woesearchaeota archaeon]
MANNIYLWTGPGWGKSTSAFGAALRAVGHGKKVEIIQFMKGRKDKIGEYRIRKKLGPKYNIEQFGREGFVNLKKPTEKDKQLAEKGLEAARKAAKKKPFLLVLDEINVAVAAGLLEEKEVIDLVDSVPKETHVYLTGRRATKGMINRADYANEIKMLKGKKKLKGEKGIDY